MLDVHTPPEYVPRSAVRVVIAGAEYARYVTDAVLLVERPRVSVAVTVAVTVPVLDITFVVVQLDPEANEPLCTSTDAWRAFNVAPVPADAVAATFSFV